MLGDGGHVLRVFAAMQDSAMHLGVQRFDATVQHFGEAGEFGDVFDVHSGFAQKFGGAAGGDEFDAEYGELAGEIYEAGFVGDAEKGALNAGTAGGHIRPHGVNDKCGATEDFISNQALAVLLAAHS